MKLKNIHYHKPSELGLTPKYASTVDECLSLIEQTKFQMSIKQLKTKVGRDNISKLNQKINKLSCGGLTIK